jgi:hypothetical protein
MKQIEISHRREIRGNGVYDPHGVEFMMKMGAFDPSNRAGRTFSPGQPLRHKKQTATLSEESIGGNIRTIWL